MIRLLQLAIGSFQFTLLSLLAKDLTFPQQPEPCVHLHVCYMVWSNTMARQPVEEFIWLMVPEGWESILEETQQQKAVTAAGTGSWELTSWTRRHKAERARTGSSLRAWTLKTLKVSALKCPETVGVISHLKYPIYPVQLSGEKQIFHFLFLYYYFFLSVLFVMFWQNLVL